MRPAIISRGTPLARALMMSAAAIKAMGMSPPAMAATALPPPWMLTMVTLSPYFSKRWRSWATQAAAASRLWNDMPTDRATSGCAVALGMPLTSSGAAAAPMADRRNVRRDSVLIFPTSLCPPENGRSGPWVPGSSWGFLLPGRTAAGGRRVLQEGGNQEAQEYRGGGALGPVGPCDRGDAA